MSERRYSEEEAEAIFEQAANVQHTAKRQVVRSEGMTLSQLEEIGQEAGIAPELVADAARSLDVAGRTTDRRFLGFPIGVGRTADLGRRLSDEEWERLVVDLRETFDARGRVSIEGSFRQWTNGNLQALLEPTGDGHRLRLRTINGTSRSFMITGLALSGFTAVMMAGAAIAGELGAAISSTGTMFMVGLGFFTVGAARLPGWARARARQMEAVIARLLERND
jgi:hypothetical protein